jgi:hypothetical protein
MNSWDIWQLTRVPGGDIEEINIGALGVFPFSQRFSQKLARSRIRTRRIREDL